MKPQIVVAFFVAAILSRCQIGTALAEPKEAIAVGAKAPAWNDLPGVDGKKHALDDLREAKLVVVAFTSNMCPYAKAYEDRFKEFAAAYAKKSVAFVAISVSKEKGDGLPAMKERAKGRAFTFPYLYDESQKIGMAYGALATPHLFVLDESRKVAYVGAFDDAKNLKKVEKQFVKDAVEALLAGKRPAVAKTPAIGCEIHYDD